MSYEFNDGPKSTKRSIEQISQTIQQVGNGKKFMGMGTRLNTSGIGSGSYGAFVPSANDDPFASARRAADWSVGWQMGNKVTNSMGMTLKQGWQIIFEVSDDGSDRTVTARVAGASSKGEVQRFVDMVFADL